MNKISKYIFNPILLGGLVMAWLPGMAQRPDRIGATSKPLQGAPYLKSRPVPPPQVNNQQRSEGNSKPFQRFAQPARENKPVFNKSYHERLAQQETSNKPHARFRQQDPLPQASAANTGRTSDAGTTILQRPQRSFGQEQSPDNNALRNRDFRSRPVENPNTTVNNSGYRTYNSNRQYNNYPQNNNRRYDYYGKSGHYNNRYSNPFRYRHSYPYYGQRFRSLNFRYNVIPFGGIGYYYYNGIYYRPFGSYYQVVPPPPGLMISMLPFGYTRVILGNAPFYYHSGTYYRQYDNYYKVVEPPLGARLPALPRGADAVYINGQRYYEDNGTYYFEEYNLKNQRLYTVVGVNGVLDNATVEGILNGSTGADNRYDVGKEIVNSLPENCTPVTINGQEYFRSQDNVYYEAITDGNNVSYQVVSD